MTTTARISSAVLAVGLSLLLVTTRALAAAGAEVTPLSGLVTYADDGVTFSTLQAARRLIQRSIAIAIPQTAPFAFQ